MRRVSWILASSLSSLMAAQDASFIQGVYYGTSFYNPPSISRNQLLVVLVYGLHIDKTALAPSYPTTELEGMSATVQDGAGEPPVPLHVARLSPIVCAPSASTKCNMTSVSLVIPAAYAPKPFPLPLSIPYSRITVSKGGSPGVASVFRWSPSDHIFTACEILFQPALQDAGGCLPLIERADGTLVSGFNPARPGETVTVYGTGFAGHVDSRMAHWFYDRDPGAVSGLPALEFKIEQRPQAGFQSFQLTIPDGPPPRADTVKHAGMCCSQALDLQPSQSL